MQTHDLRTFSTHKHLRSIGCFFLGAFCAFQVAAGDFGSSVGYVPNGNGGGNYVKFGEGTKFTTIPSGVPSAFRDIGTKGLEIRGSGLLPVGTAGRTVPVSLVGKVSPVAMGNVMRGLKAASGGGLGLAILAAGLAAPHIMGWLGDAKINVKADGTFEKTEITEGIECLSGCFEYLKVGTSSTFTKSIADACSGWVGRQFGGWATITGVISTVGGSGSACQLSSPQQPGGLWSTVTNRSIPPYNTSSTRVVPLTDDEALLDLEKYQPPPEILEDIYTIDRSGRYSDKVLKNLSITNLVASGPPTVIGPVETKVEPATVTTPEKTTTTKTDYNCTYSGPSVTCTDKKTEEVRTRTIDPVTGQPVDQTTTTTTEKETPPAEQKDPCLDHPNRNGCREDEFDTPDGEIPKTSKTITYEAENLGFGGGSCPANKTMTIKGGKVITLVDWVDNCDKITTYAKPMILAMAMFTAMLIVFGGGRLES